MREIQLISDGDGLAVIGEAADVERFLAEEGLATEGPNAKDLGLARFRDMLGIGSAAAQAWAEVAAYTGRWVKLTKKTAGAAKKYGLMKSKETGLDLGVVYAKGEAAGIKRLVQFEKGPGSLLNPSSISGVAGIMSQMAMQQAMDEITDYLTSIDKKLDDVLRAQTNAVLSRVDGVHLAIQGAMSVRAAVGRVSETTWSKIQASDTTILETQAYALRQLRDLADETSSKTTVGDIAKTGKQTEAEVQKWLAVLARCFQLQDAIAVLELDRVLDAAPDELDRHRLGLKAARENRLESITAATDHLLARINATADTANARVLLHPSKSPSVARSSARIAIEVQDFHGRLGIEAVAHGRDARRWVDAAADVRDKALEAGADGVAVARRFGSDTASRARDTTSRLASEIADRARRRGGSDET